MPASATSQWPKLAIYPDGLTQHELIERMAPDAISPSQLRVVLAALRDALEPQRAKGSPSAFVLQLGDRYVLSADQLEPTDLAQFQEALALGDRLRADRPVEAADAYERGLSAYRANLLDSAFFQKYLAAERGHFRRQALDRLMWLAEHAGNLAQPLRAQAHLQRAIALDPCHEEAYLALMRLELGAGRPERMRQIYWDYRKALKLQLGLAPSDEFEACYRAIAGGLGS